MQCLCSAVFSGAWGHVAGLLLRAAELRPLRPGPPCHERGAAQAAEAAVPRAVRTAPHSSAAASATAGRALQSYLSLPAEMAAGPPQAGPVRMRPPGSEFAPAHHAGQHGGAGLEPGRGAEGRPMVAAGSSETVQRPPA